MVVVELISALEVCFGGEVDGDEVTADVFETLGSPAAIVETTDRLAGAGEGGDDDADRGRTAPLSGEKRPGKA